MTWKSTGLTCMLGVAFVLATCLASPLWGQVNHPDREEDPLGPPTEYGLRMTPEMARGMAGMYVKHNLVSRYELKEEKTEEATELVARRLMQLAHEVDGPGSELMERFVEEQLEMVGSGGRHRFMPETFGKEFAERVLPLLPAIRGMCTGVMQDVRPMLPLKQQFKLAAEMATFHTAIDGFDKEMQRWASGEVEEFGNPFDPREREEVKLDEQGQSEHLKNARQSADSRLQHTAEKQWEHYVRQAKAFYEFDDSQSATADSILTEQLGRAETLTQDPQWRERMYRAYVWQQMSWRLPSGWNHPLRIQIERQQEELQNPLNALGEELKARIERIPTQSQRRAAERRIDDLMAEKGFTLDPPAGGSGSAKPDTPAEDSDRPDPDAPAVVNETADPDTTAEDTESPQEVMP